MKNPKQFAVQGWSESVQRWSNRKLFAHCEAAQRYAQYLTIECGGFYRVRDRQSGQVVWS